MNGLLAVAMLLTAMLSIEIRNQERSNINDHHCRFETLGYERISNRRVRNLLHYRESAPQFEQIIARQVMPSDLITLAIVIWIAVLFGNIRLLAILVLLKQT